MTIPMHNPDNGNTADVHPDEVEHMKGHGWRLSAAPSVAPSPLPPPPSAPAAKPTLSLKK